MGRSTTHAVTSPSPVPSLARGLLRRFYTSNPFYVISADLVFVGLRMSLGASGRASESGALMLALLGYTLLLAATACLLIRLGDVWDDARTLLLLVVAMFLAISVTFDETLAGNPRLGVAYYLGGLACAGAVSEGLLRGIRLRLPPLFRLPYHAALALFFLYPVALTPLLRYPESPLLRWSLFGFSPAAGLVCLALIPAVRRGPRYVERNGSPWRYPLYPWTLFGLLGAAVCGRAYYLCISFHFVGKSASIFGPYFLVPFLLAVVLLLLEAGLVARSSGAQRAALLALPGLLLLCVVGHRPADPVYRDFLDLFMSRLGGSPLYLTLLAVAAVYGVAARRRVPLALQGLTLALLALAVVGPGTVGLDGLVAPRPLPLLAVAGLQLGLALRRGETWRWLVGAVCLIDAVTVGIGRGPGFDARAAIAGHLGLAALMLAGVLFDDPVARFAQRAGAVLLALFCLIAYCGDTPDLVRGVPPWAVRAYPALATLAAVGYGYATGCRPYFGAAAVGLLGWLTVAGWQSYVALRRVLVGLDWITGGLAFFAVAAVISLGKAGLWARRVGRRGGKPLGPSLEVMD